MTKPKMKLMGSLLTVVSALVLSTQVNAKGPINGRADVDRQMSGPQKQRVQPRQMFKRPKMKMHKRRGHEGHQAGKHGHHKSGQDKMQRPPMMEKRRGMAMDRPPMMPPKGMKGPKRGEKRIGHKAFKKDRRDDRKGFKEERKDDRRDLRQGEISKDEFREKRKGARKDFKDERRDDKQAWNNGRRDDGRKKRPLKRRRPNKRGEGEGSEREPTSEPVADNSVPNLDVNLDQ